MNTPNCRHCGEPLKYRGEQPVIKTVLILGDCANPECAAFGSTMTMGSREMTGAEIAAMDAVFAGLRIGREVAA